MTVNSKQPDTGLSCLEGRTFYLGDHTGLCLVSSATTGGAFAVVEMDCDPGAGTPLHIHRNEDETIYILTGCFEIQIENRTIEAVPGDCVFALRGLAHCWRNISGSQGRFLVTYAPGGMENFYSELEQFCHTPALEPDFYLQQKVIALSDRFGVEMLPESLK